MKPQMVKDVELWLRRAKFFGHIRPLNDRSEEENQKYERLRIWLHLEWCAAVDEAEDLIWAMRSRIVTDEEFVRLRALGEKSTSPRQVRISEQRINDAITQQFRLRAIAAACGNS